MRIRHLLPMVGDHTAAAIFTVLGLIFFVGVVIWAWSPKRRSDFSRAAKLPLGADDEGGSGS